MGKRYSGLWNPLLSIRKFFKQQRHLRDEFEGNRNSMTQRMLPVTKIPGFSGRAPSLYSAHGRLFQVGGHMVLIIELNTNYLCLSPNTIRLTLY